MDDDVEEIFDARIQLPASIIICGPSQSGKTHFCVNMLNNMKRILNPQPNNIIWFFGTESETVKNLKKNNHLKMKFIEGIPKEGFRDFINNKKDGHSLFIIDDLLIECSDNHHVTNLFCREGHHKNISVILIMQDLFCSGTQRKTIIKNAHYLCLFKSPLDMNSIYSIADLSSNLCI